jgi:hypothetical protein
MARTPPFYQFVYGNQIPTPGAMALGFESEMLAMRPMIGPAIGAAFQFRTMTGTPQAYQAAAMMWLTGLTGTVHGQSILQPLSNPYG